VGKVVRFVAVRYCVETHVLWLCALWLLAPF